MYIEEPSFNRYRDAHREVYIGVPYVLGERICDAFMKGCENAFTYQEFSHHGHHSYSSVAIRSTKATRRPQSV